MHYKLGLLFVLLLAMASPSQAQLIREELIPAEITRDAEIIPTGETDGICITNTGTPAPAIALCSTLALTGKTVLYKIPEYTIANLPASHPLAIATNCLSASDCTTTGSVKVVVWWNGTAWTPLGSGSGGGSQTAATVPYTVANGANWGTDPDDVAEALDQAAARVTAIEANNQLPGTYLDDQIAVYNGTLFQAKSIPSCADTGGQHLNYTVATNTWSCGTSSTGGVSGLTVGNLHKAATTSSFGPSQVTEDADSVNSGFPVEIGSVATNSLSIDTSAITGHKVQSAQNVTDTLIYRASTDTLTNKTMSGSSNTFTNLPVSSVAAALKTKSVTFRIGSDSGATLLDTQDEANIWPNNIAAVTITEIKAWTDQGTSTINIQRDDGTPANICSSNLVVTTSGVTCTLVGAEDNLAVGEKLNFVMVTGATSGTPKRITVSIKTVLD